MKRPIRWASGITTVPSRKDTLFRLTLDSIMRAGFPWPWTFLDQATHEQAAEYKKEFGDVTVRSPGIRTYGNWILGMAELYIRNPGAGRFVMFQDDVLLCRNLREYLDRIQFPEKGYLNLYTRPDNQQGLPADVGFHPAPQKGKGALALVFTQDAMAVLLQSQHVVLKPRDAMRGWRAVDGAVWEAMREKGWKEYVHNPSLVQHAGDVSTMETRHAPVSNSFPGPDFDALSLLKEPVHAAQEENIRVG